MHVGVLRGGYFSKARFKRRTLHVPNLMQMSENNRFFLFALDSAHVKFDVWNGPNIPLYRIWRYTQYSLVVEFHVLFSYNHYYIFRTDLLQKGLV